MEWSCWRRPLFTMLVAATVLIGGCSDSQMATAPTVEPQVLSLSLAQETDFDSTMAWDWNRISPATGGDPCDPTQVIFPPECCSQDPWLPGCPPPNPQCFDESDAMAAEYGDPAYGNSLRPYCFDFTTSGGSANFLWTELNGGWSTGNPHPPWGMILTSLTDGLEATRTNYNRGRILLTSGYRCPAGNAAVDGELNSKHTHGRAADMYSAEHGGTNWTLAECGLLREAAEATSPGPAELLLCTRYTDRHLHAAW